MKLTRCDWCSEEVRDAEFEVGLSGWFTVEYHGPALFTEDAGPFHFCSQAHIGAWGNYLEDEYQEETEVEVGTGSKPTKKRRRSR
jgi:hypothetical protein